MLHRMYSPMAANRMTSAGSTAPFLTGSTHLRRLEFELSIPANGGPSTSVHSERAGRERLLISMPCRLFRRRDRLISNMGTYGLVTLRHGLTIHALRSTCPISVINLSEMLQSGTILRKEGSRPMRLVRFSSCDYTRFANATIIDRFRFFSCWPC